MLNMKKLLLLLAIIPLSGITSLSANNFKVIAHRGASGYLPEHSLASKALAHNMGADYLEQDVVLTKDNIPIILHDIEIDNVTNIAELFPNRASSDGNYYAGDFTLEEIKTLNLYERFDPKTKIYIFSDRFPIVETGLKIPTLQEEINFIKGLNKSTGKNVGLYVEIKKPAWHKERGQDISAIVLKTLTDNGYNTKEDNFYLQIFDYNELKRIRTELKFKGKLIMLITTNDEQEAPGTDYDYLITDNGVKEISLYADGIGPSIEQLISYSNGRYSPTSLAKYAHKYKLEMHPYTFRVEQLPTHIKNTDELHDILIKEVKINGLFTDFTDITVNYLNKNKLR